MAINDDSAIRNFLLKAAETKVERGSSEPEDYSDHFDFEFEVQDLGF